jgi:hypothetical protein
VDPKVDNGVHKSPPPVYIVSQLNSFKAFVCFRFNIIMPFAPRSLPTQDSTQKARVCVHALGGFRIQCSSGPCHQYDVLLRMVNAIAGTESLNN